MTDLQKKWISFQNLLVVAASGGSLGNEEEDILMAIGKDMGLTPEDLKTIITAKDLSFVLHDNLADNLADLGDMLTIAAADGIVYEAEYQVCKDFAKAAMISDEDFNEMLAYAKEYKDEDK